LSGLQLRARRIVEGYLAGLHRSPYRGFSIEFAEHREYAQGDDLRYLDWKVFARTDKLYLKQFEDETNLICYLLVDASESMQYRGGESAFSKLEYAQCLAAALAWLVLRQQDAVGLMTFDRQIREHVRPSSSAAHLQQIVHVLEHTQPRERTALGSLLGQLARSLPRRGIVVVLSDLFDDLAQLMDGLHRLRLQRHDVIVLHLLDRDELEFPFERPTLFKGLEQLPQVLADPAALRQAYRAEVEQFLRALRRGCHEHHIDFRSFCTDQPLDWVLSSLLSQRSKKVQ
jgi:uncharacterized protein (DUF58 family)